MIIQLIIFKRQRWPKLGVSRIIQCPEFQLLLAQGMTLLMVHRWKNRSLIQIKRERCRLPLFVSKRQSNKNLIKIKDKICKVQSSTIVWLNQRPVFLLQTITNSQCLPSILNHLVTPFAHVQLPIYDQFTLILGTKITNPWSSSYPRTSDRATSRTKVCQS